MKPSSFTLPALAALLFSMPAYAQQDEQYVAAHGATVPASYSIEAGDRTVHLDIWPAQAFHLLLTTGDGASEAFAGRWYADGRSLVLPLRDETLRLEVRNADRLRPEGAPYDTSGDFVGAGSLDPAAITLHAAGMFTYFADAPIFLHCATGLTHPVAQEADYLALERAYLEDRPGPAEPLFVTVEATIANRRQVEGPDRLSVMVDAFQETWPGEGAALAELEAVYLP